jgi:hypothetical protein
MRNASVGSSQRSRRSSGVRQMEFEELRTERRALNDAVVRHAASVLLFRPEQLPWFRLNADEASPQNDDGQVHHLSTTASCLESLRDVRPGQAGYAEASNAADELAETFAERALARPPMNGRARAPRASTLACERYLRSSPSPPTKSSVDTSRRSASM